VFKDQDPPVGASSRVGIITCCDARSSPDHFFQLNHNQAFIIRNGGGRTSPPDVIRTLASIEILSDIKEIMVIHHTGKRDFLIPTA
jgi:carbonic anhydrase